MDPKPRGRPTTLTRDLEAVLLAALLAVPVKKYAAEHGGISERTWHEWEAHGERDLPALAAARGIEPEDLTLDHFSFEDSPHAHFLLSVRKQRADYLTDALGRIRQAGIGYEADVVRTKTYRDKDGEIVVETVTTKKTERHWQAAAWLVERQYPEFRTSSRVEVSGPEGGPVEISTETAAERLSKVLDEMADRESKRDGLLADPVDEPGESVDNPEA